MVVDGNVAVFIQSPPAPQEMLREDFDRMLLKGATNEDGSRAASPTARTTEKGTRISHGDHKSWLDGPINAVVRRGKHNRTPSITMYAMEILCMRNPDCEGLESLRGLRAAAGAAGIRTCRGLRRSRA